MVVNDFKFFDSSASKTCQGYHRENPCSGQIYKDADLLSVDWLEEEMNALSLFEKLQKKNVRCNSNLYRISLIQEYCNNYRCSTFCCYPQLEPPKSQEYADRTARKGDLLAGGKVLKKKVSFDPKINRWSNGSSHDDNPPMIPRRINMSPSA
jgi:hypothetical protein